MIFSDVISPSKEAEDIGGFDQLEATNLELHVRQCGRRYRILDAKLTFAVRLILILVALEVLTKIPGGWSAIVKLIQQ